MNNSMEGSLESIDQMICFINTLSEIDYQFIAHPWFDSSIGQHLRHILDLYLALQNSSSTNLIDYDVRRRGAPIEISRTIGLKKLADMRGWLTEVPEATLHRETTVKTEVSLSDQKMEVFISSFGRELCFASSHLIHHLAIMAAIAKMAGKQVDPTFGLAPATATFTREKEELMTVVPPKTGSLKFSK